MKTNTVRRRGAMRISVQDIFGKEKPTRKTTIADAFWSQLTTPKGGGREPTRVAAPK